MLLLGFFSVCSTKPETFIFVIFPPASFFLFFKCVCRAEESRKDFRKVLKVQNVEVGEGIVCLVECGFAER